MATCRTAPSPSPTAASPMASSASEAAREPTTSFSGEPFSRIVSPSACRSRARRGSSSVRAPRPRYNLVVLLPAHGDLGVAIALGGGDDRQVVARLPLYFGADTAFTARADLHIDVVRDVLTRRDGRYAAGCAERYTIEAGRLADKAGRIEARLAAGKLGEAGRKLRRLERREFGGRTAKQHPREDLVLRQGRRRFEFELRIDRRTGDVNAGVDVLRVPLGRDINARLADRAVEVD